MSPDNRWQQLQAEQGREWVRHIVARRTVEWHDTVQLGRDHETTAIHTEGPLFNVHVARRGWLTPMIRWLTPADADPVPCLYRGGGWIIGHDAITAALARPPVVRGDPVRDAAERGLYDAAVGLYRGSVDEAQATQLSRLVAVLTNGRH